MPEPRLRPQVLWMQRFEPWMSIVVLSDFERRVGKESASTRSDINLYVGVLSPTWHNIPTTALCYLVLFECHISPNQWKRCNETGFAQIGICAPCIGSQYFGEQKKGTVCQGVFYGLETDHAIMSQT